MDTEEKKDVDMKYMAAGCGSSVRGPHSVCEVGRVVSEERVNISMRVLDPTMVMGAYNRGMSLAVVLT